MNRLPEPDTSAPTGIVDFISDEVVYPTIDPCGLMQNNDLFSPWSVTPDTAFSSFLPSHMLRNNSSARVFGSDISFRMLDSSPSRMHNRLSAMPALKMSL